MKNSGVNIDHRHLSCWTRRSIVRFIYTIIVSNIYNLVGTGAGNKVVTTSALVSNNTSLLAVGVDYDAVSTGLAYYVVSRWTQSCKRTESRTAVVDLAAGEDRELVVRSAHSVEVEAFVVVVLVRVGGAASSVAVLNMLARRLGSGFDSTGGVVGATASSSSTALKLSRSGADNGEDGEEGGNRELHGGRWDG